MRRWIVGIVVLAGVAGIYLASPFVALYRLGSALHAADAGAVSERIDIASLRRSIVEQVVEAVGHDAAIERELDKLGDFGRDMALRAAAGEFDRLLAATLTPELLRRLIALGELPAAASDVGAPAAGVPAGHAAFVPENPLGALRRWDYVSPRKVRAVIGDPGAPEDWTELVLRLKGAAWRLSEVKLPPSVMARIRPALQRRIDALRS